MHASLHTLAHLSANTTHLPEAAPTLTALGKALHALDALGIAPDRRLMGIDLDNLVQGFSRVVEMRAASTNPDGVDAAVADLLMLARDMHARATAALGQSAQTLALHAEIAARHATPHASHTPDVTPAWRVVAAAPTPPQSSPPGCVLPNPHAQNPQAFGRITGHAYIHELRTPQEAARHGAVLVPPGAVAHFAEGDTFALYGQGAMPGTAFRTPKRNTLVRPLLVEVARGGAVVHGPAVLATDSLPKGLLEAAWQQNQHASTPDGTRSVPTTSDVPVLAGTIVGLATVAATSLLGFSEGVQQGASPSEMQNIAMSSMVVGFFLAAMAGPLTGAFLYYAEQHYRMWRQKRNPLHARVIAFLQEHGVAIPDGDTPVSLWPVWRIDGPTDGINVLPSAQIEALHAHDLRVLQPLLALPAPTDAPSQPKAPENTPLHAAYTLAPAPQRAAT